MAVSKAYLVYSFNASLPEELCPLWKVQTEREEVPAVEVA